MEPCVFCSIVAGASPASFVHRDDRCAAFMDIKPINPGHLLVIPNRHATHLADMDSATLGHVAEIGHAMAARLRASGLRCEGVNLFLADGAAAGQEVFHVHLHVVPRFRGDGFGFRFGPDYRVRPREELDAAAAVIRANG